MTNLSSIVTPIGALLLVIGMVFGVAAVARRIGLPARWGGVPAPVQTSPICHRHRIDRSRMLSIIELDGIRFAILSGGTADQLLVVPQSSIPAEVSKL